MVRKHLLLSALIAVGVFTIPGCKGNAGPTTEQQHLVQTESQKLHDWFEARYQDQIARSPMTATYLGLDKNQDKLDDTSQLAADETTALSTAWLKEMRQNFDPDRLDAPTALSYRLYEFAAEDEIASAEYSDHDYIFNHMFGPHADLPSFLINYHKITDVRDAENLIARLGAVEAYLGHYADRAEAQAKKGILLPRFVYEKIRVASQNIISGEPFTGPGQSPLWEHFIKEIDALDIASSEKDVLRRRIKDKLLNSVQPAYENLIEMFARHEAITTDDDGAWKLPDGANYYNARLKHYTTTDMSADDIHEIGLAEVARIQDEMKAILEQVEFDASLPEFFDYLRTDPKFTLENNDDGRNQYMEQATSYIDEMKGRLDSLFITRPKADVVVKRVEPFREASAFGAFYEQPALDGSRPGAYYINLKDMSELPIYQMQALAYHEGIPGHHMQIAIGMELEGLPKFRTLGGHTAYIEGWALYSESVPKELGLYTDPYQDFGRLSMEIFRAARLVLDTGIHAKKWTREQAVNYMMENTANSEGDIRAEIDRYIVWPGQATAYKVGMLKIEALRKTAEERLGDDFDIREFHDVVLANGSVPLTVLEELVEQWIKDKTQ